MAYVFRKFLKEFADPVTGEPVYSQRMSRMCKGKPSACPVLQLPLDFTETILRWCQIGGDRQHMRSLRQCHVRLLLLHHDVGSSQQSCLMCQCANPHPM